MLFREQLDRVHGGAVNTNGLLGLKAATATRRQGDGRSRVFELGKVSAEQKKTCGCFVL